jgi:uncharacterized protein (DUF1778 family)
MQALSYPSFDGAKDSRFEAKMNSKLKEMFQFAANLQGCDLSAFILSAVAEKARSVISESQSITLNDTEHTAFMQLLNNPPKATSELKTLMNMEPLRER